MIYQKCAELFIHTTNVYVSAEHDIFGEAVSDSEDEDQNINILELEEENSRLTAEDSRMYDSASPHVSSPPPCHALL